ncbi:hypothetical protein MtrunA17_Chr6g0474521 [Medicago truncatula]|uniref:Aminotransferase-like plant mobile domain-containing protein n=1 Tax=Medicago truncatula TaxID=3880 RepID=A0A396HF22_MEDTR|nr:hypothetical protein MtrunA17_Chr6g0474521 [Medicago truncatula]
MKTLFRYLVEMKTYIGMNDTLLKELLHRWDASSLGYKVGVRTVAFKHLDLYLAPGFSIVEESFPESIDGDSHVRTLCDANEIIDINSVHSKLKVLQEGDNIDDFCRVYILFALCVLYFPKSHGNIKKDFFNLVDDLDALSTYNWDIAIYDDLMENFSSAASKYQQQKNDTAVHTSGCSTVLQLVEELIPTQEDMENNVFVQAVNHYQVGIRDGAYPLFDVQAYMAEHQRLVGKHKDLFSRVSILEDDMRILKANSVHGRENILMQSSVEVGSGSKQVGVK